VAVQTCADIRRTLTRKCALLGIPVSGTFELTPRCNLHCKMCYIRMTPEQMALVGREMTAAEWLSTARQARDAGMAFLLLTGGEPTLRADFAQIYEGLMEMGLSISINTNGTRFDGALRALFHRLPPAQVNITLYGVSREGYEALCGDGDAFDRVSAALDWLKSEGILVHLNTTMTKYNHPQWTQIEEFARVRALELRMTSYCFPPARRSICDACEDYDRLPPEAAGRLIADDILWREGPAAIQQRAENIDTPLQQGCELDIGEPMKCMAGKSQFWVNWNGTMTPCGMLDTPSVTLQGDNFAAVWEQLKQETDAIRLCPDCSSCAESATCMNCAAVTYTETGCFSGKPVYVCEMNRAYRARIREIADKLREGK